MQKKMHLLLKLNSFTYMPKVVVYNANGKENGTMDVSDVVFGATGKKDVVHQVYLALEANAREPWAHSKDRGDVRGGGKKPWKQKGTGRARHGSIRSPIWKGGGVTFGPLNVRNYVQKINKKMNKKAVQMCLKDKVKHEKFFVVESLPVSGKTKEMATFRGNMPGMGKSTLFLTNGGDDLIARSVRNIPSVHLQRAQDVNVADLLHHQYIIITKDALVSLEKRLA